MGGVEFLVEVVDEFIDSDRVWRVCVSALKTLPSGDIVQFNSRHAIVPPREGREFTAAIAAARKEVSERARLAFV